MFRYHLKTVIMFIAFLLMIMLNSGCYKPLKAQKIEFTENAYLYGQVEDALVLVKSRSDDLIGFGYETCGNGTIISEDGYILTVSHALINKHPIIELSNQKRFRAEVIYNNKKFDIAILKINSIEKLPYLEIAPNSFLGQRIYLFGKLKRDISPQLFKGTINAKGLNLSSKEITWIKHNIRGNVKSDHAVQNGIIHSARFKSGFSGGPIVNISGQIIAINIGHFGKSTQCISLSQEVTPYLPVIKNVVAQKEIDSSFYNFDINLENSVERMEWIMDGLVNHCIFDGNDPVCVNTLRQDVEQQAKEKMSKPLSSDVNTIKWAWKTFLKKIECY